MDVSVIIVNFNVDMLVCKAVSSIIRHTSKLEYEILIADNSPGTGLKQKLSEFSEVPLSYLEMPSNIGFGQANNAASLIAKGEYLLFLNPDTELTENTIYGIYKMLRADHGIGVAGCNMIGRDGKPDYSFRRFFPSVLWELNDLFSCLPEKIVFGKSANYNCTHSILDVAYATGSCLMISLNVFRMVGGFDKAFFLYFEETDLCHSVRKSGYRIVNTPLISVIHDSGGSFHDYESREKEYFKGKITYFRKNLSGLEFRTAVFINRITIISRLAFSWIINNRRRIDEWRIRRNALKLALSTKSAIK